MSVYNVSIDHFKLLPIMPCEVIQKGKEKEKGERKNLKKKVEERVFPPSLFIPFLNDVTWHFGQRHLK